VIILVNEHGPISHSDAEDVDIAAHYIAWLSGDCHYCDWGDQVLGPDDVSEYVFK
jgi:hypothetical protein